MEKSFNTLYQEDFPLGYHLLGSRGAVCHAVTDLPGTRHPFLKFDVMKSSLDNQEDVVQVAVGGVPQEIDPHSLRELRSKLPFDAGWSTSQV